MEEIYLTELHLHTKESSSCSNIPAKEMIEAYKEKGYSTIVITDHCSKGKMERLGNISWKQKMDYVFTGFDIAKEYGESLGLNILLGVEITLHQTDSDYLVYGIDQDFLYNNEKIYEYSLPKLYNLEDLARGGIVTTEKIKDINQLVKVLKNREYKVIKDGKQ